jgi:hypothetical protein
MPESDSFTLTTVDNNTTPAGPISVLFETQRIDQEFTLLSKQATEKGEAHYLFGVVPLQRKYSAYGACQTQKSVPPYIFDYQVFM